MRSFLALLALMAIATVVLCKPSDASTGFAATPDDPQYNPPTPTKKCTGCLFNDSALGTSSMEIKPGCSITLRRTRSGFNNDDCTKKKAGPGCPDSKCKFIWKVEAKRSATGCSGVTWSISGGNQGVNTLTGTYRTVYKDDQTTPGQDCGTIVDRRGTITGEWTNSSGDQQTNAAVWDSAVGCTVCTEPQE